LAVGPKGREVEVIAREGNLVKGQNVAVQTIGYTAGTVNIPLPAMSIVTDVIIKVTTAYSGGGTINIGDANDDDGFLPNASITKTAGAVSGGDVASRGAYLYDTTNKTKLVKLYPSATNVKVTIGNGFSAGAAKVYVVYTKLE
jgi:hypothetical protein